MGARFLLGRSGKDKSARILDEIKTKIINDPQGPPVFYIVPDQMTFQQEYALLNGKDIQGSIRAQVVSFSRLAWRILQETGGSSRQFISSIGIQMMLRKIVKDNTSGWQSFQKGIRKQGFLEQLEQMITEFKRYRITPEMLDKEISEMNHVVHKEPTEIALLKKLTDISYIYKKLEYNLKDKYIDSEDQLALLAEKINQSTSLSSAEIYFDGFHRFTPKELQVVEALMKSCKKVTFALTLDDEKQTVVNELDLFYQTSETYQVLKSIAEDKQIAIDEIVRLDSKYEKFKDRPFFAYLEENFNVWPANAYQKEAPIKIQAAAHPRAEVEGAAQEIIRLVRDEHYRFRDIATFVRQTNVYHDLIATIFREYNIPVFIDEKRTMSNHTFIECIRSTLEIVEGDWRYDVIFRVLKTGFIPSTDTEYPLTYDAIDELENYCLEYGIRSREQWFSEKPWIFQRFHGFDQTKQTDAEKEKEKRINRYRKQVVQGLKDVDENFRKSNTMKENCRILYEWLERNEVPVYLKALRTFFDGQGNIEKSREQEQVWIAFIQLLDEMVEIAGEETMTLATFRSTLDAGLAALKFSHVPPSMDQVIVGTVDRSRISGVKCAFLLGVNDGIWPMKPKSDSVINEQERELLNNHGLKLANSTRRQLLDDWFYMYLTFTQATDRLWISYPLSDEEGKPKMRSQLIKRMEDFFPVCTNHGLLQDSDELIKADQFITTPLKTRSALITQLARSKKGYPIQQIWWHVLNWYILNHEKYGLTYKILQSLYYQNRPVHLSKETVNKLYPKQINASVTMLETYYRSPYDYFAKYTLGLKERKIYKLDRLDIGQLFHEALKKISEWIEDDGKDFSKLSKEDAEIYAKKAVALLAPILKHQILHRSNRYKYMEQKLQDVIAKSVFILSEQARKSNFIPIGVELGFGKNRTLPPIKIPLKTGFEVHLSGRIDRVDKALFQDELFLRIIDYKSSSRGLDLTEVYYGLALQMLIYLDVVLSHSKHWLGVKAKPAGALYFHVHDPMISTGKMLGDTDIKNRILKKYKMQGILLDNKKIVKFMDTTLGIGASSIIPAGIKSDGSFNSYSRVVGYETFYYLIQHVKNLVIHAFTDITNGFIRLNPYQYKNKTGITFSPYHSVSQFDPSLEGNEYRKLKELTDEEVLDLIMK
ncbi:helicase-exonuclease AddAB subunit AddB [Virgibacillus indicus]|uniref:ATP-dependent helicase/deoxyribonuclease subunit B n=1 Tax=Virgibacillus indicus TaxID=2024554 RepID=A0A265NAL9_9BACI|nr:helicase-exonuclease AddAB subunit AddB [Virgibacillus indicus]OZU89082.1 helicase-exonuclease AddAB subunit AddB [Virgibacillus indicus]